MSGNSVMAPRNESTGLTEEKPSRKAVRKELNDMFNERSAAQQEFDDLDNIYREQLADYKVAFAKGETVQTQSEFDVGYFMDCRSATRRLIEAEESFAEAKSRALAIGAVGSTFDQPQYGNCMDQWENQSETAEELLERNALCVWSFVGEWVVSLADTERVAESHLTEVDDWDTRSISLGESRSVAADVEMYRDKIESWRESCISSASKCWAKSTQRCGSSSIGMSVLCTLSVIQNDTYVVLNLCSFVVP
ncbi:hypothetical protein N7G274_002606 [Stereocaulon virgatum]|uniref:Uncharacterized protein n=1 Tax=Stereocaulon virgatum TaxID=373712 RepID=A0ABR4AH38_9LECA